jgi:S1-C subfamily serine protease
MTNSFKNGTKKVKDFIWIVAITLIVFGFLCGACWGSDFAPDKIVRKIEKHSVAIAVYYTVTEASLKGYWKPFIKEDENSTVQVTVLGKEGDEFRYVVFLGAGTVLRNDYIITVAHLFTHEEESIEMRIFVFIKGSRVALDGELMNKSNPTTTPYDYAIVRTPDSTGLPGIKISRHEPMLGDKVCYIGNTEGLAFNIRFGFIGQNKHYFRRGNEGALHLSFWEDFPFWTVTPGGSGDSGGGIFNDKGELVTLMYCGLTVADEGYVFANPNAMLWNYLDAQDMLWLGR